MNKETQEVSEERQVDEQLGIYGKNLEELQFFLDELLNRLSPVLFVYPQGKDEQCEAVKSLCPLAEELRSKNDILYSQVQKVGDIIKALEI